jgi:hypothetical protein
MHFAVEFPCSVTDGGRYVQEGDPTGYRGRQHNGTCWSNTTNPPAITVKGF